MPKSNASKKIEGYIPFVLTSDKPTEMHVSFYADGIKYDYDVTFNRDYILKEVLNYYPKKAKSLFYERTFVEDKVQADIKFGSSLKLQVKTQDSIRENTLNNHSVLSVCNKAAFKEDIEPFNVLSNWIMTNCHDVDADGDKEKGIVEILNEAYTDVKKRKFFNQMLNILEYKPTVEDRTISQEFRDRIKQEDIPDKMKEALLKSTVESITFLNHSENGNFEIPLKLLSKGTMKYVRILNTLYDMVTSSHVYYLDELGEDLHYDLLFYYLNVFSLIQTNHSLLLLVRRQLYFLKI
jgi:predicted ATPase